MLNNRGRVLAVVLAVVFVAVLTVILVARGSAVTVQQAPYGTAYTVNSGTVSNRTLPLNTPVRISIAGAGASSANATIVATCWGGRWSWVGQNGNGVGIAGHNVTAPATVMCTTMIGHYVRVYNTTGAIQIQSATGAGAVRVFIQY